MGREGLEGSWTSFSGGGCGKMSRRARLDKGKEEQAMQGERSRSLGSQGGGRPKAVTTKIILWNRMVGEKQARTEKETRGLGRPFRGGAKVRWKNVIAGGGFPWGMLFFE